MSGKGEKRIKLSICNIEYDISAFLSLKNIETVCKNREQSHDLTIAQLIHDNINCEKENKPTIEDIRKNASDLYNPFIMSVVQNDSDLLNCFNHLSSESYLPTRFCLAVYEIERKLGEKLIETINSEPLKMIQTSLTEQKAKYQLASKKIQETAENIANAVNNAFRIISQYNANIEDSILALSRTICEIGNQFDSIIQGLKIPTLTEEKKKQVIDSSKKWASYGWSIIDWASVTLFHSAPQNKKEADQIALEYFSKKALIELFTKIKGAKGVKKHDIEEAIKSFENKQYKSCTMIIFSMIDSKLIRLQGRATKDKKNQRASGVNAIKKIQKHIEQQFTENSQLYLLCNITNVIATMKAFFEKGNDFRKQPLVANRIFIDHGMLYRRVTRKDCLQIFLLYYNFLELIDKFL